MDKSMRIAVICGDASTEREISLKSGKALRGPWKPDLITLRCLILRRRTI